MSPSLSLLTATLHSKGEMGHTLVAMVTHWYDDVGYGSTKRTSSEGEREREINNSNTNYSYLIIFLDEWVEFRHFLMHFKQKQ